MTAPTIEETIDQFRYWETAVTMYGENLAEHSGEALHALGAHLAVCQVITSSAVLSEQLPAQEVDEAGETLAAYGHVEDVLLAELASAGWLEPAACSCSGCDSLTYIPALPSWSWLLFRLDEQERQYSDLIQYVESLGGSPEGYTAFVENVFYPGGEAG